MGYESRLYLALPSSMAWDVHKTDDEGHWTPEVTGRKAYSVQVVAMVDLSKAGYDNATGLLLAASREAEKARLAASTEEAPVHGYGLYVSGDVFDDHDKYGDPIAPVDLDALLQALATDLYGPDGGYRRFAIALDLLTSWKRLQRQFGAESTDERFRPVVLQYGY
jgi:hypothetical protein